MQKRKFFILRVVIIVNLALVVGCTSSTATPEQSEAPEPSPSLSPTETHTQTTEPTSTLTLTLTPIPAPTESPTTTPSPTPNMVMPGTYYASGCGSTKMSQGGYLDFCVTGVTVDNDRHMIFDVTWTLSKIPSGFTVTKKSDQGNRQMYLIDNLGNRYNHSAGGDDAYNSVVVKDGVPASGWFDFGLASVGAFTFDFHDDDNGIVVSGISLYGAPSAPPIHFNSFKLDPYPMSLNYQEEIWQPSTIEDGSVILASKTVHFCTLRAISPRQPKGDFKSNTAIGVITFDIYGHFDDGIGLFVREYVYVSGLSGVDPNMRPIFVVTIPGDNSLACILDSSSLFLSISTNPP